MVDNNAWAARFRAELEGNILPYWQRTVIDRRRGGFFGEVDSSGAVHPEAPRASVINTRILWTFSAGARRLDPAYRDTADWAYDAVATRFWDEAFGGLYWLIDPAGRPLSDRKQIYAQAFGIYALAEHHRATGEGASLALARRLFGLIDEHSRDPANLGYVEALGRDWSALADMRLSDKDINCPKSMNTHLHVLEGYTNLLRVWRDPLLVARHKELLQVMLDRIVSGGHFKLFFDQDWTSLSDHVSFGHDIEGSWLLVEAAAMVGDAALTAQTRKVALAMADAVLAEGVDEDGSVFFEADGHGNLVDATKHWWVQAEAVVGFFNAWQLSGEERFLTASRRVWDYIDARVIDRVHGEWYAKLTRRGVPLTDGSDPDAYIVGPWKCPYHNARLCYEMMGRLGET
ncbi:MAG: AGE family epimerase/isomerase [Alphaproteobacteria bacterium]|nr:AGE family epimerase/isomerase [Alphaproteobacteria bacterium]